MTTLDQYNFKDKKALVRVDFNVPLDEKFSITDDTRIRAAVPTIKKILSDGGSVILMSHLGRPKEGIELKFSLKHLVDNLIEKLNCPVFFADDCIGESAQTLAKNLKNGEVLLLENLRFYKQEEKGDLDFSAKLATLGDVYVNDAFGTAHRAHASTTIIAGFFLKDKVCGYLMQSELYNASKIFTNVQRPFTAIIGGVKISDKIKVIEKLLDKVDNLLIGGAMAYTFFKSKGGEVGNSLVEVDKFSLANQLMDLASAKKIRLHLPVDSLTASSFNNDARTEITLSEEINDGMMGVDIGPNARQNFCTIIHDSKTILWNGPMGAFEMPNFAKGTIEVAQAVAEATQKGAYSLIGGGDSASAINQLGFYDKVSYVSTGGGALLEYFEGKVLPGVAALG